MRKGKLLLILLLLSFISSAQTIPPTNLKATLISLNSTINKAVSLTWDYRSAITVLVNFNIYRKAGPIASTTPIVKIATTNQTSYIDSKVEGGGTYIYFVTAVINTDESGPSNMVQITIPPLPVTGAGKICGHVYDDTSKTPIVNGTVVFYFCVSPTATTTAALLGGKTDNNGNFSAILKPGLYYLYTTAKGYAGEFYDNVKTIQNATKITLKTNDSLFFRIGLKRGASIIGIAGGIREFITDTIINTSLNGGLNLSKSNIMEANKKTMIVDGYELNQNYPNPFNPSTNISYKIPENCFVSLKVYNILGKETATLVNESQTAGKYSFKFRADNLESGIYFYKLTAGNFTAVRKFILLK